MGSGCTCPDSGDRTRGAGVEEDYPLHVHTRDFLDKLKAQNRKTNVIDLGEAAIVPPPRQAAFLMVHSSSRPTRVTIR